MADLALYKTGPLKKAGAKGRSVLGMSNFKVKFFALSPEGLLSYYEDKATFQRAGKPTNEVPYDLRQCVIKFDLSKSKSSKHHPIHIAPKNWQGGEKILELEADSIAVRDQWRNWIRAALNTPVAAASRTAAAPSPQQPAAAASPVRAPRSPPAAEEPARSPLPPPPQQQQQQQHSPQNEVTTREARTEVGALLRECRMEEYTRQIVTEECFENVADLRALTPEEYQLFSTRVGLKLGQARKLQKRLGMQVDTGVGGTSPGARKTGAADSADSSAGAMIGISSSKDTKTSSQSEEEAWAMVKQLQDEIKVMRAEQTSGSSIEGMLSSWTSGATGMATGKLLTNHIPVVVATAEVTLATIAADAGDEDNAVRRIKFEAQAIGLDVTVNAFGEPLTVSEVDPNGPAAKQGVEVGDLLIDANGQSIPTDRPEAELRHIFAGFKRPVTLGFYKLRKATEQARRASIDVRGGEIRGVAFTRSAEVLKSHLRYFRLMPVEGGGGASAQPQVLRIDGCPDGDCNGTYTIQPHKVVNGYARYLKNHSFYYIYKTTTGHWMITWFEPDIDEDKGEYRSEDPIDTPELPTRWVGGPSGDEYPAMVVYVRGSVPFQGGA